MLHEQTDLRYQVQSFNPRVKTDLIDKDDTTPCQQLIEAVMQAENPTLQKRKAEPVTNHQKTDRQLQLEPLRDRTGEHSHTHHQSEQDVPPFNTVTDKLLSNDSIGVSVIGKRNG